LRNDLEAALLAQGLFPREAQAMLETWKGSWFEEGSRLIYIVPSRAIDAIPLQVEPVPAAVARVFVGRIELITPETQRLVTEAISRNDSATLERYGRFLDPILTRISAKMPAEAQYIERIRQNRRAPFASGTCR